MRFPSLPIVAASLALLSPENAPAEPGPEPASGAKVPAAIAVPSGHQLAFTLEADGVQIYACTASGGTYAWVLQAPEAKLSEGSAPAGTHFAGPTWQANDGSKVVGAKVEAVTPDAASIPWLLLRATSHAGSGRMGEITFVQRIRTSGGNAPAQGCDASHAGTEVRVPYRAAYAFYKKA